MLRTTTLTLSWALTVSLLPVASSPLCAQLSTAELAGLPADKAIEMAGLQLKLGDLDASRAALKTVLDSDSKNFQALRMLAEIELQSRHYPEAEKAASQALALSPDDVQSRVIKGGALMRQGKKEQASKVFATLSSSDIDRSIAELPEDTQLPETAKEDSYSLELERKLSAFYVASANKEQGRAREILAELEPNWGSNPDFQAAKSQHLQETGDQLGALKLLEELRANHKAESGAFPYKLELAAAYEATKQLDKAKAIYGEVAASTDVLPEQRQAASQALYELRHDQMLDDGDKALSSGDLSRASELSGELLTLAPEDPTVRTFQASVLKAQGRHVEAARVLSSLKQQVQPGQRFDTQLEYAGSLASARRYDQAIRAYEEVVANTTAYSEAERKEAANELTDLRENHLPGALVEGTYIKMDEGTAWRAAGDFSSSRLSNGMRLHVRGSEDNIELSPRAYPEALRIDRWSAQVGFDKGITDRLITYVYGGAHNEGGMASAMVEYSGSNNLSASLRAGWNDPARDTFLLEAMNGRQSGIAANLSMPLGEQIAIDATVSGRQITIDGEDIGTSLDSEAQVRWHPLGVKRDVYLGYNVQIMDYSPNENVFKTVESKYFSKTNALFLPSAYDAVPDSIRRHALQLHGSTNLAPDLIAGATLEAAYREESGQIEYAAMAELLYHATELVDLNARAEYYTSGSGPNIGNNVLLGTLGLKVAW
jgi:predicted Zn-dependent protease